MKIAFLNLHQSAVNRGLETVIFELARRLSVRHKVDVIAGKGQILMRWPVLWRFFLDPNGFSVLWFTLKSLPKIFREKYDVVVPGNGGWQPAVIRLATWLYGGKMVISGQSGIGWDDKNNLWCLPDAFVALSSYAKDWAEKVNPFVKIFYIPNGVDIKKFTPTGAKLKINLKSPIVITVGALTKTKRLNLVIEAVAKVKNASLLLVGDGELKEGLETLGKRLLGDRFILVKLPFSEMPKVYRSANIFTLVSEAYYSFEMAVVEALATNLPVVVNNDPIRKAIVADAGFLVNPEDTVNYAKALSNALKKNWRDEPRTQAMKFSWDKISQKYEELFLSLVRK